MRHFLVSSYSVSFVRDRGGYYFLFIKSDDGKPTDDTVTVANEPDTLDTVQKYFNEQLQEGVIDRIGQPIEGFVPFMFMQAFSGIVPQDFDGADALLGKYKVVNKELTFIMDEGGPIHSAAEALSEEGMKTLFSNITNRAEETMGNGTTLFSTTDEIDELLLFLGAPLEVVRCIPEQRGVEACIEIYRPVCAKVNIQCITTPCEPVEETFSNSCIACSNCLVESYTEGECIQ